MTAQEIRKAYLEFFKERGHAVIPRAPLIPQNDPTTLFTGSGMQPLIPYLLGEPHPEGTRLVNSQTCLRAQDIDEVGDNRHTTFFEMLGNWSLGDYFKKEQIPWFFEFLTDVVGLDPNKLYVTCFIGDQKNNIPKDEEAANIWRDLFAKKGIEAKVVEIGSEADGYQKGSQGGRVFYYDASKNWWCRSGKIDDMPAGEPGGPDTEVFYEYDFIEHDKKWGEHCHPNCDCGRFLEIGNSVFMEYVRKENGFEKLPKQNVDFGGGLERIAAAQLNNPDVFRISLLWPVIEELEKLSGKNYESHTESMRVIADHVRGATFLAIDGVIPSNKEQGYVARRLLRRAIRYALELGIEQNFLEQIAPIIADMYQNDFPEVKQNRDKVIETLVNEEKLFRQTLRNGVRELKKLAAGRKLNGGHIFILHDTYGFPVELSLEEAILQGVEIHENWRDEFNKKMGEQRERSQTAGKGVFKGGLADHSEETTRLHTAHHLLLKALKDVLGDHVVQRGSNITSERLRIDFSHPEKVTREQLDEIERIVNKKIVEDLPVIRSTLALEEAEKLNAEHEFGAKYPDMVSVYSIGPKDATDENPLHEQAYSIEFCGGPHIQRTNQLAEGGKHFKILKEEASSAGIRRIKAVLQ